jgi:hypothetical protein
MPRLTLLLLTVACLAAVAGATYALRFNPEMDFWKEAAERKLEWADQMRAKHGRAIGIIGGSTTTFGIDADYLQREHNLPVANLGLHAGMGPDVCAGFGFAALRKNDMLIASLEPSMLWDESGPQPLGTKLAVALGQHDILHWDDPPSPLSRMSIATQLQPGGYHVVTMLGKLAMHKPLYRYSIDKAMPGGLQVTSERRTFTASMDLSAEPSLPDLAVRGRKLLQRIKNEADRRGIAVAYLLPWAYCPEDSADLCRAANEKLLAQIEEFMPVLREPNLGVHSLLEDFSDSGQHLTAEAARRRSKVLSATLRRFSESRPIP